MRIIMFCTRNHNIRSRRKKSFLFYILIFCAAVISSCGPAQTERNTPADGMRDAGIVKEEGNTENTGDADDLNMRMGGREYVKRNCAGMRSVTLFRILPIVTKL